MNQKVREIIERCSSCQAVGISNPVEPMKITPTEDISWYHIVIEFLGAILKSYQLKLYFQNWIESLQLTRFLLGVSH